MPNAVSVQRTRSGSGVPISSLGKDRDVYIDTATKKIYLKSAGAWSATGQLAASVTNIAANFVCPDTTTREATLSNP